MRTIYYQLFRYLFEVLANNNFGKANAVLRSTEVPAIIDEQSEYAKNGRLTL